MKQINDITKIYHNLDKSGIRYFQGQHLSGVTVHVNDDHRSGKDWLEEAMATIPSDVNSRNGKKKALQLGSGVLQKSKQVNLTKKKQDIAVYSDVTVRSEDDQQREKDWLEEAMATIHL